jgi:endonuclease YncB( thermonuclease family)
MAAKQEQVYATSRRRRAALIGVGLLAMVLLIAVDRYMFASRRAGRFGEGQRAGARDLTRYHGRHFRVTRVIDGDTLSLDVPDGAQPATRVRLLGIDAPEMAHRDHPPMFYSREASDRARELTRGADVTVYLDETGRRRGHYGRLLAYLELPDGRFLNELLLSEGCAYADRRFPHSYRHKYRQLEAGARALGEGLWREVSREQLPVWLQNMDPDLLAP